MDIYVLLMNYASFVVCLTADMSVFDCNIFIYAAAGDLQTRLEQQWGSVEAFKTAFSAQTVAVQG